MDRTLNKCFRTTSPDYSYQQAIAGKAIGILKKRNRLLISAYCGAGKTSIMAAVIEKFIRQNGPGSKVAVICENLNNLKDQFLDYLRSPYYPVSFTFGEIDEEVQVKVFVAAGLPKLAWDSLDLLIVDEGHRYYKASRIQKFLHQIKPRKQILFTGSPSQFLNDPSLEKLVISGDELMKKGVYSSCELYVTRVQNKSNPAVVVRSFLEHADEVQADLSKVLVVCPTIAFAEKVASELRAKGFKTFLTTSKNDPNNMILSSGKASDSGFYVTVGKCSLGFNDESISTLLDCKSSGSLDNSNQIFARILRRSKRCATKSYFRVSNTDTSSYNQNVFMLHKLKALMSHQIFSGYNGRNLKVQIDG